MIRLMGAILLFGVAVLPVSAADKYVSKEGKYTVIFPPGMPREKTSDVKSSVGDLKMYLTTVERENNVAFMVSYNDYPAEVGKARPQKILENIRDGSRGTTGRLIKDDELTLAPDRLPARDFLIDRGGNFYRSRAILDGTRLYQVIVVSRSEKDVISKEADAFIDSFAVSK